MKVEIQNISRVGKWGADVGTHVVFTRTKGGAWPQAHGMPSVGAAVGLGEYASSWISGARVLFSVALSISLTPGPPDRPSQVGLAYLWKHEVCPCGGHRDKLGSFCFHRSFYWGKKKRRSCANLDFLNFYIKWRELQVLSDQLKSRN